MRTKCALFLFDEDQLVSVRDTCGMREDNFVREGQRPKERRWNI